MVFTPKHCGQSIKFWWFYSSVIGGLFLVQECLFVWHLTFVQSTLTYCISSLQDVLKSENDHINLKVAGQDGSVVQFKIKKHTPLSKLMKAYCERQGLAIRQIRFRFDGQPINETDTPAQLEMEDEDTIDVFQQQTGGHYWRLLLPMWLPDPWIICASNTASYSQQQFGKHL